MASSENPQTDPISIQLPRLFPHSGYQPLSEPLSSTDPLSQTSISDTIPSNTNPAVQTDLVRTSAANTNKGRSAEAQFKESFERFYQKYSSNQAFVLILFSIFTFGYFLKKKEDEGGLALGLCLSLLDVFYLASLIAACSRKRTMIDSFRLTYKILEYLIVHAMFYWGFNPIVFFMISYLFKVVVAYFSNCCGLIKFTDQVNQIILGIRIGIFAQGILIIATLKASIPFLLKFFPLCAIILVIILFIANLIKKVFFTYNDSQFRTTMNENKTGVRWIFGNLFGLIGILILQAYFLLIDEFDGTLKPCVFIVAILWCSISLMHGALYYNQVFKVCETLAILMEIDENMSTNEEIKYVKRVSYTYFRPATEQEIDNFADRTDSVEGEMEMEIDLEAGVEEERPQCTVCCRELANAVFVECGHGGLCFECGEEINKQKKECHICRQRIREILKMNIMKTNEDNVYEIVQAISSQKMELCWDNINI